MKLQLSQWAFLLQSYNDLHTILAESMPKQRFLEVKLVGFCETENT